MLYGKRGSGMRKIVKWIIWGVLIAIILIRMTAQQLTINKYNAELDALEERANASQERIAELETMNDMFMTDEYIEREARKRGYVHKDEKIFREAE